MSDFTVREAWPDDVSDIRRIAERAWRTAYGDFLDESTIDAAMAEWYDPDVIQERIDSDTVGYFVADDGRAVLGFVNGGPADEDGVAFLGAIYVDPDHWREGVGSALLGTFEAFCREHDYNSMQFGVLSDNDVGRSFYQQYGYERVDEREGNLFGETVTEQVFRRTLE